MHFNMKNNSGFTLIEVLIAIMLLAFISLYTYKMIDNGTDTKDRVLKEDKLLIQTLTAISRIDSDLNQIYSPLFSYSKATPSADPNAVYQDNIAPSGLFDGKTKNGMLIPQFFSEDKSTLVFFTASNRRKVSDTKESRFTWVKYSLRHTEYSSDEKENIDEKTKGTEELVRQTISSNIYTNDLNWSDVKAQVLLTHVKSIAFSFWSEKEKKYTTSLQDLNELKNNIRSLKLSMIWVDEDNHEQKIEKSFRILSPYFNTKADDLAKSDAYGGGTPPPGTPNPNDVDTSGGANEKHF